MTLFSSPSMHPKKGEMGRKSRWDTSTLATWCQWEQRSSQWMIMGSIWSKERKINYFGWQPDTFDATTFVRGMVTRDTWSRQQTRECWTNGQADAKQPLLLSSAYPSHLWPKMFWDRWWLEDALLFCCHSSHKWLHNNGKGMGQRVQLRVQARDQARIGMLRWATQFSMAQEIWQHTGPGCSTMPPTTMSLPTIWHWLYGDRLRTKGLFKVWWMPMWRTNF